MVMLQKCDRTAKNIIADGIRALVLSWLMAVLVEYWMIGKELRDLSGLEGLALMSLIRLICMTGGMTLILMAANHFFPTERIQRWGILAVGALLIIMALQVSFSWGFFLLCSLVFAGFAGFARWGWNDREEEFVAAEKAKSAHIGVLIGASTAFFLLASAWTVGKVMCFSTPTFDFGIFSQMFYNMKQSGLPLTTVERDGLLSHFAVHVSPIYYLLLPFYCLFPTPATLQILQAAVITSAVIPLWLIGKKHGLSPVQRVILCVLLMLYPAYLGGTSYDIHENCFLTPLVLWLFYGIDKKNIPVTGITALLILSVKEDAAVYVAVIGLYLMVKGLLRLKRGAKFELSVGAGLLAISLICFFMVTGYLAKYGDGVMTWRYQNFMYDGSTSLLTVIKSVVLAPMKAIYECADQEKLGFLALTLGPILGLPLLTRRYERYILLIPYVLVNLMPDYTYQHNIYFQYTFGSNAFLFYLLVVNLADWKIEKRRTVALIMATVVSGACFAVTIVPTAMYYPVQAVRNESQYQAIRDTLDTIPEDASVTATTFYTTYLSQREILYDVRYSSWEHLVETDFVVLSLGATDDCRKYSPTRGEDGVEQLCLLLEQNGYEEYQKIEGTLVIYAKEMTLD